MRMGKIIIGIIFYISIGSIIPFIILLIFKFIKFVIMLKRRFLDIMNGIWIDIKNKNFENLEESITEIFTFSGLVGCLLFGICIVLYRIFYYR
ncbi:hypothetical protein MVQ23_02630 [Fusobacterium necrophorum]|uniref:hypothetical protein n=1 Tax=Fusobacterium necrophorum TaxID=859 RepID=UPI00254C7760|nr:hypothetical protein [Fusobacterium necrophorum]MDK4484758.1 hypothetical protein [Fusobacterium necrophorum]